MNKLNAPASIFRRRGILLVAILLAVLALASTMMPAHSIGEKTAYSTFYENSATAYRGVDADWTDASWSNIPCPDSIGRISSMNTWINAFGDFNPGTNEVAFVQLGSRKKRQYKDGPCVTDYVYFWERRYFGSYNYGEIQNPTPPGTHHFTLSRYNGACASGVNWCWEFRIDGNVKHTCCGDQSELADSVELVAGLECKWDTTASDCPGSGLVDPMNELSYKTPTGTWPDWAGQDDYCVHHGKKMRGKWKSAKSIKVGANVTMSDSLSGC